MGNQMIALVIDDDDIIRMVMKNLLTKEGCIVEEAADGSEGLQKILEIAPDIIFCDRLMPNLSGFALLEYLEKKLPQNKADFVFLTNLTDQRDKDAVINMNVADYLEKPITPESLQACLKHLKNRKSH